MGQPSPHNYAVLGYPIAHSLSPRIHRAFASSVGQAMTYRAIAVQSGEFTQFMASETGNQLAGANVTLPHKQAALAFSAHATERARRAGAANTLVRDSDGAWQADNTDGVGLCRDLMVNLAWPIAGRTLLILGAGGATRGILGPLLEAEPKRVVVANRTLARAEQLAADFPIEPAPLDGVSGRWDAVIHASAAGHQAGALNLEGVHIGNRGWAYDLSYGAAATPFLTWAANEAVSARVDGLGMLVEQAAESFERWRGVRPETSTILSALRAG